MKNKLFKYLSIVIVSIFISCSSGGDSGTNTVPAPVVTIYANQVQAAVEKNILFSLTGDLPNDIGNINWDFGDGTFFYGNNSHYAVYHPYSTIGNYTVKATILRQNGEIIESTKVVTIVNTNMVKVTTITVQNYPEKLCEKFVASGASGYWVQFYGKWDESQGFGPTSDVNRFSDTFLTLVKYQKRPNSTNPSELVSISTAYSNTPIQLNQLNNIFNVSSLNIVLSLSAIDSFGVGVYDDDNSYSLYENTTASDGIGSFDIEPSSFQNNSFLMSDGQLVIKVDYQNIN
jgi:PKD repeat protein